MRGELPQQRTEMVAEFRDAGIEEPLDRVAGVTQHAPVNGKPRTLEREHKTRRNLARPFPKSGRRLRAVECAVDLDRGQPFAGVGEFLRVRQTRRIEYAAPRLERPAAGADIK